MTCFSQQTETIILLLRLKTQSSVESLETPLDCFKMAMDLSYGHSPFPFSDRPSLPDIDNHVTNDKLKSRQFVQAGSGTVPQQPVEDAREEEVAESYGYFTLKEIKGVYKFIKHCGIPEERRFGISLDELESGFRKVRRARQSKDEEASARRLMNTFEFLLKLKRMTPKAWFKMVDTSQANKGDGKLTPLEFETGMARTCHELGATLFLKHELQSMIKYMDPNGDGDLSYMEVQYGFEKIHKSSESSDIILQSGPIMLYLLDFMHDQQIRVRDLFNFMDLKNRKVVELQNLCDGIDRIAAFLQPNQTLIEEYGSLKRNLGPIKPVSSLAEADSVHVPLARKKKRSHAQQEKRGSQGGTGGLPNVNTRRSASANSLSTGGFMPLSPIRRTQKDYDKQVKKNFSLYNDWMHQFDRKLHNGLIMMSKM